MKLAIFERKTLKKGETKRIRREGGIPALLYGASKAVRHIYVQGAEFQALLRHIPAGTLATTVFELGDGAEPIAAIVKDIHYHVVDYSIQHLDFLLLDKNVPVTVNVPIQVVGTAECPGIKLGGNLRQVVRTLKVRCLPAHIPSAFQLDVGLMQMAESKRLSDIALPSTLRSLAEMREVVVVIAKQKQ